MKKSLRATFSIFISFALVFGVFSVNGNIYGQSVTGTMNMNKQPTTTPPPPSTSTPSTNASTGTVTRDAVTLLLEGKTLPKGSFIELYDSTPYKIVTGHFVAKVPCNTKSQSEVALLTGVAPNFKSSPAELIAPLSTPGNLCLYHVDLTSDNTNTVTDVAIKNNSTRDITFPPSSSAGVGVDVIAPLPPGQG
jgi:ABC-type antimicrobial peptide transport system permease subunit